MKKQTAKKIMTLAMALVMMIMIAACGKKEEKTGEEAAFIDAKEDGSVVVNLDKTAEKTGGGTGITIEDGEYLVIDTDLTEGKVHITVIGGGSDINDSPEKESETPATIDHVFEGKSSVEYMEIKPGDYMFNVVVEEEATGTITACKKNVSEDSSQTGATAAAQ